MTNWNKPLVTERFEAEYLIKQAIERHKPHIYVAFSGGKSSEVVLHMSLKIWSDIPVMFCNTGVEMPETIEFVHKLKNDWKLNLIETHPYKKTFWKCVEDYGLPHWKTDKSKMRPKCCYYLKHRPAEIKAKELGLIACITGIQGTESYGRRRLIRYCGQRYQVKKTNIWQFHPIAFWDDKRVWEYIKGNGLPYNMAYDKYPSCNRTGCLPCTAHKNWRKKLEEQNPKMLKIIEKKEARKEQMKKEAGR